MGRIILKRKSGGTKKHGRPNVALPGDGRVPLLWPQEKEGLKKPYQSEATILRTG